MIYNIGDFVFTYRSWRPAFIVSKNQQNKRYLVSIYEFGGDYKWITNDEIIEKMDLKSEEKLSIIANFGDWFYDEHKLIYQELIIENLGA